MAEPPIAPGKVPSDIFPTFVDSSADFAMFALDPTGVVSSWNPGAHRIKGWTAEEIVGQHLSVFYTRSDVADRKPQYVLQRAASEGRFEEEGWRVRKDGTIFWANVVLTAIRARDGSLRGYVKVTRDMTARRHSEDALRQSEERYRLLVESVKDYAIFILDPMGHVLSWNAGAERLKGYKVEEIVGHHFRVFYTAADRERRHPEDELRIARAEGRYEEEGWRVRKDGTTFWANVTITALFDETGRHLGFAKVTRDLTERKRAEEELRQRADSYATINRELDAFSHTVAHDLRSPIRAVEHLSSVLLDEEKARLSPDGRQSLEALHTTALSMARLVQDLLDLSTASGREPARREVDVTALAREVAADAIANNLKDAPRPDVTVQEGMRADADPHLLRVLLNNLLTNAVKFSRTRTAPRVEVGQAMTDRGQAFFVRDNGVGFDPRLTAQLFRPFSRLHEAGPFEGTGIGLATVARIVKRHGGTVWAEGKPDGGATLYFTLPGGGSA